MYFDVNFDITPCTCYNGVNIKITGENRYESFTDYF